MAYTPHFGDLPAAGQALLTRTFDLDFSMSDFKAPRWFSAWAYDEDGSFAGIFAIEFKYWFDGYVTILVLDQRCMTKRVLRAIFTAAFAQARRLTAEIEPHNRRALKQVQRLGFVYEGMRRLGLEGSRDVLCYGMLKQECRYLSGYVRPALPKLDTADVVLRDTVIATDSGPAARVRTNSPHLFSSKPRHLVVFAALLVGVVGAFSNVFFTGFPADMLRVEAARRGATMGSVFPASRPSRITVRQFAENTMHLPAGAFPAHLRIAVLIDGERPEQALVSGVEDSGGEEFHGGHIMHKGVIPLVYEAVNRYKIRT